MISGLDSYDEWMYDNAPDAGCPPDFPDPDERDRLDVTLEEIELERTSLSDIDLILRQGIADGYTAASVLSFLADVEAQHGHPTRVALAAYILEAGNAPALTSA